MELGRRKSNDIEKQKLSLLCLTWFGSMDRVHTLWTMENGNSMAKILT